MSTPAPTSPVETKLASIEARLVAFEQKQVGWLKANWPHFVTWAAGAALAVKHLI